MTICKRLVEMMGGSISVDSVLEKGSNFVVVIPDVSISHKAPRTVEQNPAHETKRSKEASALVADDESNRELSNHPQTADLSELLKAIDSDFMGRWKELEKLMSMKTVRKFAGELEALGSKYTVTRVSDYGRALLLYADSYDVENVAIMIKKFPHMINELKLLEENNRDIQ